MATACSLRYDLPQHPKEHSNLNKNLYSTTDQSSLIPPTFLTPQQAIEAPATNRVFLVQKPRPILASCVHDHAGKSSSLQETVLDLRSANSALKHDLDEALAATEQISSKNEALHLKLQEEIMELKDENKRLTSNHSTEVTTLQCALDKSIGETDQVSQANSTRQLAFEQSSATLNESLIKLQTTNT